eukprot:TRINITY_DN13020_c0_g1_i1.p1 TRINITY_DN13020_c0_g1~~TRINITY_DN13020_c0_g1_i1.p1  ORF type:complete len:1584 (-),score=357.76 TRINITY_DN13020_c0_g1_i1:90-4673(-)
MEDDQSARVDGIVTSDGSFDGHIYAKDDVFYIEPTHRYFKSDSMQDFPAVIYRSDHVQHPDEDEFGNIHCDSHNLYLKAKERWMKDKSTSEDLSSQFVPFHDHNKHQHRSQMFKSFQVDRDSDTLSSVINNQVSSKYSDSEMLVQQPPVRNSVFQELLNNLETDIHSVQKPNSFTNKQKLSGQPLFESLPTNDRFVDGVLKVEEAPHTQAFKTTIPLKTNRQAKNKRASGDYFDKRKTTCMLYLQADHLFYQKMGQSEEACIEVMTRHVQRVNSIYRAVDFDMDGKPDNISFMIKRIKVHTQDALEDPSYRFPGNYGVEKFLEIFSEEDYDAFCLAYMFTYRDFEGGTLGLAWTGDLKNAGGVCEKNGHYRGSFKSLNTGIITLMNYGKHVPPAVSHVTMAHEMGHNFGSPHDPEADKDCVPGGEDGNYIMFARATSGDKYNNKRFSPCSLKSINKVLQVKARGPKGCFNEPEIAICGNGVVEDGEECDCGWEEDCLEDCCWPQRTKYSSNQLPCTLRPAKQCSPSQGPCCDRDCSFNIGNKCRDDNGCRDQSYCNGQGTHCPPSQLKPNKTVCNEEFVCFQGECTGSICLAYGLESCQCMEGPDDSPTKACELCCKEAGEDKPCLSSFELNAKPQDVPDMFSKPGTPCNNYQGYCDVFQKCREVDPLGPLLTLRRLLLSDKSIAALKRFIVKYWYSVILAAIAVIALMVTIVKLCGKKTPLLHRRKRRRKTLYHENGPEFEPSAPDLDTIHVHPTAMKPNIALPRSKYKAYKETRKTERSERKQKEQNTKNIQKGGANTKDFIDNQRKYESAQNLATKLTAKLMAVLPPENGKLTKEKLKYVKVENETSSEDQTKQGNNERMSRKDIEENIRVRDPKSASPEKQRRTEMSNIKKRRSKSATVPSKSFEKLDIIQSKQGKGKSNNRKDNSSKEKKDVITSEKSPNLKEVTIAKLGPFKMSVEVKNQGQNPEIKVKERSRSKGRLLEEKGPSSDDFKYPKQKVGNEVERSRSKSKINNKKLDEVHIVQANKRGDSPRDDSKPDKSTAESLKYEHQISVDVKKNKRKKDKILVSKLAKSDRPLREKSPEKQLKAKSKDSLSRRDESDDNSSLDYRLTLNRKKKEQFALGKYTRSISQPGPPPNTDLILSDIIFNDSGNQINLKRNHSFTLEEKKNLPKLKRSSTTKDSSEGGSRSNKVSAEISLTEKKNVSKKADDLSLYDNLGYDKSPDLRQKLKGFDKRQQTLQNLKDQIHCQLKKASTNSPAASISLTSTAKRKSNNAKDNRYLPMNEEIDNDIKISDEPFIASDSDCSSDPRRQSPPTQVQSLSEESSGCSTRRKNKHLSETLDFDSSDSENELSSSGPFPGIYDLDTELGRVHTLPRKGSKAQLLNSGSDTSSDLEDLPQYAANPHVRLPQGVVPIPMPRKSLDTLGTTDRTENYNNKLVISDEGCDSDSTLDPRPENPRSCSMSKRQRRGRNWNISEQEDTEQWEAGSDWEIKEDSDGVTDNDLITDDNISIVTDGVAQQMMY